MDPAYPDGSFNRSVAATYCDGPVGVKRKEKFLRSKLAAIPRSARSRLRAASEIPSTDDTVRNESKRGKGRGGEGVTPSTCRGETSRCLPLSPSPTPPLSRGQRHGATDTISISAPFHSTRSPARRPSNS